MRCYGLSLLLGWLATTTFAQTDLDVAERIRLRELLRVSALTEFSLQPKMPLPQQVSLQVYLGFGLDYETQHNFVRWIEEWNRKQKPPRLNLVISENIEQANVILARYLENETTLETRVYSPGGGAISVYHKTTSQQEKLTPVLAYILLPRQIAPLHLQVIWRGETEMKQKTKIEAGTNAGWQLRQAFFDLLNSHSKVR